MERVLRKPYQISLWEDRVYYIYSKGGVICETDYLPTEEEFTLINEYTKELRLAIIGSDTMESNIKAINPVLTRNLNGSNTFSFQLPYQYYDESTGDFKINPFTKLVINERKLKLNYDGEWFDFIIKNIEENNTSHMFTYSAIDLHINELSKNGYNIQLDTELQNNMGTSQELGARVLEDTEWKVVGSNEVITLSTGETLQSEVIQQTKIELLMVYQLKENLSAFNMRNKTETLELTAGQAIYIPQSSFTAGEKFIQFFYTSTGKFEVNSEGTIINTNNWEASTPNDLFVKDENNNIVYGQLDLDKVTVSREYRGESLIKKQQSIYLTGIKRYCDVYEKDGEKYYSFKKSVYADASEIQNILTNSFNFEVDSGWYVQGTCEVEPAYQANNEGETVSALRLAFASDGYIVNDGFYSNRAKIGSFTDGEKYYFAAKICGDYNPIAYASVMAYYVTKDPDKVNGKTYYYLDKNRNYTKVKASEVFTSNRVYFEGKEIMTFFENTKTSITETGGSMSDLVGYTVWTGIVEDSFSATDLQETYDLVFQLYGVNQGYVEDFKLFKQMFDKNGKVIVPNLTEDCESIVEEKYHFFLASQLTEKKVTSVDDLAFSDICNFGEIEDLGYKGIYSDDYEKVTTLDGSKSNCFNLIQTLCENFECWAKFVVDHSEYGEILYDYQLTKDKEVMLGKKYYKKRTSAATNGIDGQYEIIDSSGYSSPEGLFYERVYAKYVCFKKFIGQDNFAGFRYGINLKSIKRTVESNQIVTKLIVEPNSNEYATNGYCSIQNSELNPIGEAVIYDFDYYIKKGLLHKEALYDDLYGTASHCIGYFVNTEKINRELKPIIAERAQVSTAIDKYTSDKQTYETSVEKALEKKATAIESIASVLDISIEQAEILQTSDANISIVNKWIVQRDEYSANAKTWEKLLAASTKLLDKAEEKYQELYDKEIEGLRKKLSLERAFYRKYNRYIQEGTWQSEDYYDDNLYYLDALSVSYTSAYPQISYNINVLELSQVEGFEIYSFKIGDKTYIEDTEFFGWDEETGRPYQEEIVVSEIKIHLDDPSQNNLKVQNYKTQFEDLFQRIAATTQSLQYASGSFKRASEAIQNDGTISGNIMQNSLTNNSLVLQNAKDQSVVWDKTGITITSLASPNEIVRLVSGGIMLTTDGGRNWTTGITAHGISANVVTAGRLDTNKIRIFNENAQTFEWNSTGINAYEINEDGMTVYNNFIRFDQYGIYRCKNVAEDYDPSKEADPEESIRANSTFSLTKMGLSFSSEDSNGRLILHADETGNYIEIGNDIHTAKFGMLGITDLIGPNTNASRNLMRILDVNNKFIVYEDGTIKATNGYFSGEVVASDFKIGPPETTVSALDTNNRIKGDYLSLSGVSVLNSKNEIIFAVNTEEHPDTVYFNGAINMAAGSTIDWEKVHEENWDKSALYDVLSTSLGEITGTSISGTTIESPVVLSGKFRAQGGKTIMSMTSNGLYMRKTESNDDSNAQFDPTTFLNLSYVPEKDLDTETNTKVETGIIFPAIFLGMGQSETNYINKGLIMKLEQGLWIGDSDNVIYEQDNDQQIHSEGWAYTGSIDNPEAAFKGTGIMVNFDDKQIYVNCDYNGTDISLPLIDLIKKVISDFSDGLSTEPIFGSDITFTSEWCEDSTMPYLAYTPSTATLDGKTPLIIWLHGSGEVGVTEAAFRATGLPAVMDNWALQGFNSYIVCPRLSVDDWRTAEEELLVLISYVINKYKVNTNKVILMGHSLGGMGVEYYATNYTSFFSCQVIMSGYETGVDITTMKEFPTKIYAESTDYSSYYATLQENYGEDACTVLNCEHSEVPKIALELDENSDGISDLIYWALSQSK